MNHNMCPICKIPPTNLFRLYAVKADCPICLRTIDDEIFGTLQCGHVYHINCITHALPSLSLKITSEPLQMHETLSIHEPLLIYESLLINESIQEQINRPVNNEWCKLCCSLCLLPFIGFMIYDFLMDIF